MKRFSEEEIVKMIDTHFIRKVTITRIAKDNQVSRKWLQNQFKLRGFIGINLNYKFSNVNVFDIIDSEDKAYWLGFLYADGAVAKNDRVLELSLKLSDKEHLEKFKKFLNSDIEVKTDSFRCRFSIGSKKLCSSLIKLGCVNKKSLILQFPTEQQVPKELQKHFIRGYFDGDGCITNPLTNQNSCSVLGTKAMLEGIKNFFNLNNILAINNKKSNANCYNLVLHGNNCRRFLSALYKDSSINLTRKYYRFLIKFACYNGNIIMKGGKISEIHQDKLDNTERLALDYLLKMQTLQSIGIEQISKIHSQESPQPKQMML
jgi:intein/homing endonuclease